MKTIKWTGRNTACNVTWKAEAESYRELYDILVDNDVISVIDGDPLTIAECKKNGITYDDLFVDDEYIYDTLASKPEWKELTEDEIRLVIVNQNGNAFYQDLEEVEE